MAEAAFSYDIAVIGGGASGLAASVLAARIAGGRFSVALIEKAPRVGRKLLATGNGTCNISNKGAVVERYHGARPEFVIPSLEKFSPDDVCSFFTSIGVECTQREDGRIYPLSLQAGAVLDCLRMESEALGVHNILDTVVTHIKKTDDGFLIKTSNGEIGAQRVLVCTGGAASPSLGGSAESYSLLTDIGHHLTPFFPSIVQVCTDTKFIKAVKGIRVEASIAFELDGNRLAIEEGEVLFTEYGLSGPAVMQISRLVADWERRRAGKMMAVLNLLPDLDEDMLSKSLKRRALMKGRS
ncbi:MAG: aminoacetone oxidase family FAD-binding enzyme, partial [Oscillospiraceae bacterium]|nr:aminoacetone oxidase family FAD-binding enzyme [Oscillospiraceae bacterium]